MNLLINGHFSHVLVFGFHGCLCMARTDLTLGRTVGTAILNVEILNSILTKSLTDSITVCLFSRNLTILTSSTTSDGCSLRARFKPNKNARYRIIIVQVQMYFGSQFTNESLLIFFESLILPSS